MSKLRTDASTYSLDVEMFIAEIQKYPVIWDLNCQDYRYKTKKRAAWDEIAKKFIAELDDLPELEKMDVYRKLHSKWRNIRDSYVRHMKRPENKRGYMYARHLTFLNNLYSHSYSTDEDEHDGSEEELPRRRRPDPHDAAWPSDTDDAPADRLKRPRLKNAVELEPYESGCYRVEDEDRSFFESLLPAVRRFDIDQKLELRSEILRLVKNIRCGAVSNKIKVEPPEDGLV